MKMQGSLFVSRYSSFGTFFLLTAILTAGILAAAHECSAGPASSGQTAPAFRLHDLQGSSFDLSQLEDRAMVVLYFFDPASKSSREGLTALSELAERYKAADLTVWAVTASPAEKVGGSGIASNIALPILLDEEQEVSALYDAKLILPTTCIIGPGLEVLDRLQGGGKSTELMLTRLAERELQRRNVQVAMAISDRVIEEDPRNIEARAVKGYAALKSGDVDKAGKVFGELAEKSGKAEVLGKEGLAAVHARKGDTEKAIELAEEVERKAPERSYPHVIKGDLLYARNRVEDARAEYGKAVGKKEAAPYQRAAGYNQNGRMYAMNGEYEAARKFYDMAVEIDPYYIEGTTNKGMTYEKEGRWDKALESYRQALTVEKNDGFAVVLAKKAQEMLDLQKDAQRSARVDRLVKELAERFRKQRKTASKDEDTWTSRPMVISFVDFQEKGGLPERDGYATVLTLQLADRLNASKRVQVVERAVLERLLEELNLGSSELADPETALRLGRVLAAKLIGTGSLFYLPGGTMMSLRLIDTETTSIPMVVSRDLGSMSSLDRQLDQLNREILKTVISRYPLRGYVVKPMGDRIMINLGSDQGVVLGTKFDVLQEQEPVRYKGKLLQASARSIGLIEVVQVEPGLSFAKIVQQERKLQTDDKIEEKLETASSSTL